MKLCSSRMLSRWAVMGLASTLLEGAASHSVTYNHNVGMSAADLSASMELDEFGKQHGFEIWRENEDIDEAATPAVPRKLQSALNDFVFQSECVPASCESATAFSTLVDKSVIPCGQCVYMDSEGVVDLTSGLNIIGKLQFRNGHAGVTITTPFVVVQGELEILSDKVISPENKGVEFMLTGGPSEVTPYGVNEGNCGGPCPLGSKAFVVAGGKLSITAMPPSCATWTKITDTKNSGVAFAVTAGDYDEPAQAPNGCDGSVLYDETFDGSFGTDILWTGGLGTTVHHEGNTNSGLVVTKRMITDQGPFADITHLKSCMLPGVEYIFNAKVKLSSPDPGQAGQPTTCKLTGNNCLEMHTEFQKLDKSIVKDPRAKMFQTNAPNYDELFHFAASFKFTEQQLSTDSVYLVIYMSGPEAGIDIILEEFELDLPVAESYPDPANVCEDLAIGGDANLNGYAPFPMWSFKDLIKMEEDSNMFYRLTNRQDRWDGFHQKFPGKCIEPEIFYDFSVDIRLHSDTVETAYAEIDIKDENGATMADSINIVNCQPQSSSDGWKTCSGQMILDAANAQTVRDAPRVELNIRMQGSGNNEAFDMDIDNVQFSPAKGPLDILVLENTDSKISGCWGVGSEVLLTSQTLEYDDDEVRTIQEVTTSSDGAFVSVKLDSAIYPVSVLNDDDPNAAVFAGEVALLTRNVIVQGDDTNGPQGEGGYLQIYYTPDVQQTIEGMEFRKMGQQGVWDRYPIHFDQCKDAGSGSRVSMNTIRDSFQRCIVLEGTNSAIISRNVAYNTKGHCYVLEDRTEEHNTFEYNLGARTNRQDADKELYSHERNDPSTFLCTNLNNHWIGNVAAGSYDVGFYFLLESSTQGDSKSSYSGPSPRDTSIATFQDNTAHSNSKGFYGTRLYQSSTFSNIQAYRNFEGMRMYYGRHLVFDGGVFADNRLQGFFDRSDDFIISGATIRGYTPAYKNLLQDRIMHDAVVYQLCHSSLDIVGLKIPTKVERHGRRGMTLVDVQFSDFDHAAEGGCSSDSSPFRYDDTLTDGHFNFVSSFQGVTLDDSRSGLILDKCHGNDINGKVIDDIVITDADSSFNPNSSSSFSGVSSIVSNEPYMTTFAEDSGASCISDELGCMAYCEDVCLRTVDFFVEMFGTENWVLVVKKKDDPSVSISAPGHGVFWYSGENYYHRRFSASLPSGRYVAQFQDESGNVAWPRYVQERWDLKPDCSGYPSAGDIEMIQPQLLDGDCDDLVLNDHMDGNYDPWGHNGGKIKFEPNFGVNGTGAIRSEKRTRTYHGLGQYLDTRCVENYQGQQLEFSAQVRLIDSAQNAVYCDPNLRSGNNVCPRMDIKRSYERTATREDIKSDDQYVLASVVRTYDAIAADEFYMIHGVFTVTKDWYTNAFSYFMYVRGRHKTGIDMVLDEVSLAPLQSSCSSNIVLNGDFRNGNTKYWEPNDDEPYLEIVDGKGGEGDYALKVYNRGSSHYNTVRQDLPMSCLKEGDRYLVHVEFRLEKDGVPFGCKPSTSNAATRCLEADIKSYHSQGDEQKTVAYTAASVDQTSWNYIVGTFEATNKMYTVDEKLTLFFQRLDPSVDIIINDVSITHLPSDCSHLILNSDFEVGRADHWRETSLGGSETDIVPGYNSAYAIRSYNRNDIYRGVKQRLDRSCMTPGDEYIVSAMIKLQRADGTPAGCDPNEFDDTDLICPSVVIYGDNCPGGDRYTRMYNELILPWKSEGFNHFEAKFMADESLILCQTVDVQINKVNKNFDIILDDFEIRHTNVTEAPTKAPTASPTYSSSPTSTPTISQVPSSMPSGAPTQVAINCTGAGEELTNITSGTAFLTKTKPGILCTLTKRTFVGGAVTSIVPLARSYDGNDWEDAAGEFASNLFADQEWNCYQSACAINLPALPTNLDAIEERYVLTSYEYDIGDRDKVARLLESCTFGTTKSLLDSWNYAATMDTEAASWVQEQMNTPLTSHREFWRERGNQRSIKPFDIGTPDHPCDRLSRWRKYTFTRWDRSRENAMLVHLEVVPLDTEGPYLLKTNGHPRTVVNGIQFRNTAYSLDTNHIYEICSWPYTPSPKYPRGRLWLRAEDGSCQEVDRSNANPLVDLTTASSHLTGIHILQIPSTAQLDMISGSFSNEEEYILVDGLSDATCDSLGLVIESDDAPVFAQLENGEWLQFDPRLRLEENTVNAPISDGGGTNLIISGEETLCSNVPRNFLNKDNCILSTNSTACGTVSPAGIEFALDQTNLLKIHELTGRYVYEIEGLPVKDQLGETVPHPCTEDWRSRWEITAGDCPNPSTNAQMVNTLIGLFTNSGDTNPYIRDINFPKSGVSCGSFDDNEVEIEIQNGAECWTHKHPEHRSVYDMTYWTRNDTHVGNRVANDMGRYNPIKKWIDVYGVATLRFPAVHPDLPLNFNHEEARWEMNVAHFTYVGRFGDTIRFRDLPNELRLEVISDHYSSGDEQSGAGVIVCGSPGEVSNNPFKEDIFHVSLHNDWDIQGSSTLERQKSTVWTMVVLSSEDQLRQRMAYALSQILVVATSAIESRDRNTEIFLQYYDTFVRNAFGNYGDLLKEISYSPVMAENLSFLQSKSHAYVMDRYAQNSFADENYAREVMQLFSTGFELLNLDGTPKLDEKGLPISVYNTSHIMSFARGWTGFDRQKKRGNTEEHEGSGNRIDPMKVWADWRDKFPKIDMHTGYIGDRYPLCEDLPDKIFLQKGAMYHLLGKSSLPELIEDDDNFQVDPTIKRMTLDTTSYLYKALCMENSGECQYAAEVELDATYNCTGQECNVDTLRVVEVGSGIFYEYVRPACVELPFFNDARKLSRKKRSWSGSVCGNPSLPTASEACCPLPLTFGTKYAERNQVYDGERMTYALAEQRCLSSGGTLCDYDEIVIDESHKIGYHWTPDPCEIRIKIDKNGLVAIVYEMQTPSSKVSWIDDNNQNFFEVRWDGGTFPSAVNNCGSSHKGKCENLQGGGCLCQTSVIEEAVFDSMPTSEDIVLSLLSIGAFDPNIHSPGKYSMTHSSHTSIAAYHMEDGVYDKNTIFEVTDAFGRTFFLKNVRSTVQMESLFGDSVDFSFRNPPSFMSLVPTEATVRDAQYETDAILDEYLYHPNTAPFLCIRLIQRFGISNPAPRYVKACATAFQQGTYFAGGQTFGTEKYGCLNATVASIVLDREARSVVLDADPSQGSLREPLLKVVGLMRSMELDREEHVRQIELRDMEERIGQMAHEFETVFSYFLPDYQPDGVITTASLFSPESQLLDMPKTVSLLNGLFSMIKFGLSSCNGGFGVNSGSGSCTDGLYNQASAVLKFAPSSNQASDIINELATLMTAGRLSEKNREVIKAAYESAESEASGLLIAQQLISTTPEFHTTNIIKHKEDSRELPEPVVPSDRPYKAVIFLMFGGGCDSFNMLTPHTCAPADANTPDLSQQYESVRQNIKLDKNNLLQIPANGQVCEMFGVHPSLLVLADLYDKGSALFFANTGALDEYVDETNYKDKMVTRLFAHNTMQTAAKKIDPHKEIRGTGVLGRMNDVLTQNGFKTSTISIGSASSALVGQPGLSSSPNIISKDGIEEFNPVSKGQRMSQEDMFQTIRALNNATHVDSGFFGETWSSKLIKSLVSNDDLYQVLEATGTNVTFPDTNLGRQFEIVSRMMKAHRERGVDRDIFYVQMGGFDTHSDVLETLIENFEEANGAIDALVEELTINSLWKNTTLMQHSDFARTLVPNGGEGSDHAWGGNYFMIGGSVDGGRILGQYPEHLTEGSRYILSRGRVVPTTAWDMIWNGIAEWFGITGSGLNMTLPNRGSFPVDDLFTADELYK